MLSNLDDVLKRTKAGGQDSVCIGDVNQLFSSIDLIQSKKTI